MRIIKNLVIKVILLSFFITSLQTSTAIAGGGCGFSTPKISKSLVKPGESFSVDFSFIQNDSDIDYTDPNVAPEVNFSSSINFLKQKMVYIGLDSNKWALYRAMFQVPSTFIGNQNLQAVIIYPRCGGKTRDITYGPYLSIQSSNIIESCTIEELQVNDYSVRSGESFKVAFKVYSKLQDLKPVIELTDYLGIKSFTPRLAGSSGNDLKLYEATLAYSQNYQYPYGAIARAEITGFCNSSGQRQVIGTSGYVTSQAIIQPIYPGSNCEVEGSKVLTNTEQAVSEELYCNRDPLKGNNLSWMNYAMIAKIPSISVKAQPCEKMYTTQMVMNQKFYCTIRENQLVWLAEKEINLAIMQELRSYQNAKSKTLLNLVQKAKKLNPEKAKSLEDFWNEYNQYISKVPESIKNSIQEFIFIDAQFESYLQKFYALQSSISNQKASLEKKTITCVKGKLTKKVTAINPVCPTGFKKK